MAEWHTWDAVRDELGDSLGSPVEQAQRVEQLRRELALLRLVELRTRPAGQRQLMTLTTNTSASGSVVRTATIAAA